MRTNEELAMLAKERDKGAMAELWEQTYWLICKLLGKYYPLCARYGLEPEDLTQSAYFGLVRAVNDYKPDKGWFFSTYLTFHVGNAARKALGFKQRRQTPPPYVQSLDEQLHGVEDESLTLGETISDERAAAELERIQDDWQHEQLRACLDACMADMPPELTATLRARYYEGKTLQRIADDIGISSAMVRQREINGLRQLCRLKYARRLQPFLESASCGGCGLAAFKERKFVSKVEALAGAF